MTSITVFTTTYNRAKLLKRVYDSLCVQTHKEFSWMIIDDGSTDGTSELVKMWVEENIIQIKYIYKENGGVHTARNLAYDAIQSELCLQIDSDDWLINDTIEVVLHLWRENKERKYAGIVGLCFNAKGQLVGSKLPNIKSAPFRHINTKYKVTGDKFYVFKTTILKNIPSYPIFPNENRVPIAWKYSQIPDDLEMLILNRPLCYVDYQQDGISANIRTQYFKNPKGMAAGYEMVLKNSYGIRQLLVSSIKFSAFSIIAKNKQIIRKSPKPITTFITFPLGLLSFLYITLRWGNGCIIKKTRSKGR